MELPYYVIRSADSGQRWTSDLDTVMRWLCWYYMIAVIYCPLVFFLASSSPPGISHKYIIPLLLPATRKCPSALSYSTLIVS